MMPVQIDEEVLGDIAESTGGRYFRATDADALGRIYQQIDRLERAPVQVTVYTERDEAYRVPLMIGLAALALELLVAAAFVVRVP
jgi:Ca-activated chloride channel family protein